MVKANRNHRNPLLSSRAQFPLKGAFNPHFLRKNKLIGGICRWLGAWKPIFTKGLSLIGIISIALFLTGLISSEGTAELNSYFPNNGMSDNRYYTKFLDENGLPRQIFVVAGGAPRTGSTLIFNILRVLMRIRDPNTVASSNWMLAKLVPENKTLEEYDRIGLLRTMGTSLLVKVHTAKQYYDFVGSLHKNKFADEVDLLVTGYRDLRAETVSAMKIFVKNQTEWESAKKWSELCLALIRRRNSLIKEAGSRVPIVDIRYEDWKEGGVHAMLTLVRQLGAALPWHYTEDDYKRTLEEVVKLRVPAGGEIGNRVEWHVSNLMSPKHISVEEMDQDLLSRGVASIISEPGCQQWLEEKNYV